MSDKRQGMASSLLSYTRTPLTLPGNWWVQWAALGIGIAWVISLFRVIMAVLVAGGIAALIAALKK